MAEDILSGFQINWITLHDINTGELLWHGNEDYSSPEKEFKIEIPKKIFECLAVSREVNFSSIELWNHLKLVQTFLYKGTILDEWVLDYGPVIPNTINCWQLVIQAAPEVKMMNGDILSGNVVIVSKFYNDELLVTTSKTRLYFV